MIEIGDLVWQDTDDAKPAVSVAEPRQQGCQPKGFAAKFLGVAMQRSRSGEPRRFAWPPPACSSSIAPAARSSWATWSAPTATPAAPPC